MQTGATIDISKFLPNFQKISFSPEYFQMTSNLESPENAPVIYRIDNFISTILGSIHTCDLLGVNYSLNNV